MEQSDTELKTLYWKQWTALFEAALTGTANKITAICAPADLANNAAHIAFAGMQKLIDLHKLELQSK